MSSLSRPAEPSPIMNQQIQASITRATDRLRKRMATLGPLGPLVARDFAALARDRIDISSGRPIVREGERCPVTYLVERGWAMRVRTMSSGRRQIVNFALPGDILCADSSLFGVSGTDIIARTDVRLFRIDTPSAEELFQRRPGLAAAIAWTTGQEESMLAERLVSLGRRDSLAKLSHALCEMMERLDVIGEVEDGAIETPLNQEDFADMLGISVIHVNRTFRRLSEEEVAKYRKGRVLILDRERLKQMAGFDADYLRLTAAS